MVNKFIVIGHVGNDPLIKNFDDNSVSSFSLGVTERAYKLRNGREIPEKTDWFNIVTSGGLTRIIENYVQKGSKLYIEGKLKNRSYQKDGQTHYVTEVVCQNIELLSPRNKDDQGQQNNSGISGNNIPVDDLPF